MPIVNCPSIDEAATQIDEETIWLHRETHRHPAMVRSPELSEAAAGYLCATFGGHAVTVMRALYPFNGEDFALFLQRVPGAMFYLGVANPEAGLNGVPHSPNVAADECALGSVSAQWPGSWRAGWPPEAERGGACLSDTE